LDNLLRRFQGVVIDEIHFGNFIVYQDLKKLFRIAGLVRGQLIGCDDARQRTGFQPEPSAFGALVYFQLQIAVEAVPIQQSGAAVRAGVLDVAEDVNPIGPWDI